MSYTYETLRGDGGKRIGEIRRYSNRNVEAYLYESERNPRSGPLRLVAYFDALDNKTYDADGNQICWGNSAAGYLEKNAERLLEDL